MNLKITGKIFIATVLCFLLENRIQGQNLITNPSFESGMTGYNNLVASPGSATFGITTSVVEQGTQAFNVTINALGTNVYDIQTLGPTVNLTVGQTYTLTFYAKSSTAGAVVNILFQNTKYLSQSFTLTNSYTAYTWTFVAQETSPSLRFQFSNTANLGQTIYLDNFNLPTPAVVNTSFSDTSAINTSLTYQTITGLGGGICFYENWLTAHPNKSQVYNLIFKDLGITFLRLFNQNTSTASPNFSGDVEVVTTATNLLGYTPKILVSSWSPPAELKANNSANGTNQNPLTSAPYPTLVYQNGSYVYSDFANWWKQSVLLYQQNGINPDYISLQNEPNWNPGYQGCLFNSTENATIAGFPQALSALRTSINTITNKRPKILGPEVFGIGYNAFQDYVNNLNSSDADAFCYHQYTGGSFLTPDSFNPNLAGVGSLSASKGKQVFMTEFIGVTPSQNGQDTLSNTLNLAWLIHNNLTQANASAYIFWDLVWGGKSGDIIGLENPWTPSSWQTPNGYLVQQQYYALKQFTKFVRSGWVRVSAGNNSTNFRSSAYQSTGGDSMAVVILNVGYSAGSMGLNLGSFVASSGLIYQTDGSTLQCTNTGAYQQGAALSLPARSITTITLNRNKNPLVAITSPGNNAVFLSPVTIPVGISASDVDGTVVTVKFLDNGTLLKTLTSTSFNFSWTNAALGIHTLTAIAIDNSGGTTTSNPVFITVKPACPLPTTVSGFTGTSTICGTGNLVISAIPVASVSGYLWVGNGVTIVSGQNTATVTINVATTNGSVTVYPFNGCGTASGTTLVISSYSYTTPSANILSSSASVCAGIGVTFTASGVNAGTAPSYAWFKNGVNVGSGSTYGYIPLNGDALFARLTAGGTLPTCLSTTTTSSNVVNLTVTPIPSASISISSSATSVCSGVGVTFTATGTNGGTAPTYAWFRNNVQVSTGNAYSYIPQNGDAVLAKLTAGGTLPTCLLNTTASSNVVNINVNPIPTASITISSSATSVCSGAGVTFTATGTNAGTIPTFAWFKNNIQVATGNTYSYIPQNGDAVFAKLTVGGTLPTCLLNTTASSNVMNISVSQISTASITISSSATSVCSGAGVTFTTTGTNGGTTPTYAWYKNNVQVATGNTFNYIPQNGDAVYANILAGGTLPTCLLNITASSNLVNLTVSPIPTASISISSSATSVCSGVGVTFTATGTNGGTAPTYAWFRNNVQVSTGNAYSYIPQNGDAVLAKLTAGGTLPTCLLNTTASSNVVNINVNPIPTASITISSSATSVCSGAGVTFTATGTNGGTTPTFAWFKNNVQVATGITYSYSPQNGDAVFVKLTAGGTLPLCLSPSTGVSNIVNLTVNSLLPVSLTVAPNTVSVCTGAGTTFTAVGVNIGATTLYTWYVNNLPVSTGSTFTYAPTNGDLVKAILTTGGSCITGSPAQSNVVPVSVAPLTQTSVTVGPSANPTCSNAGVVYSAIVSNGGTNPSFIWSVNGIAQTGNASTFNYTPSNNDAIIAKVTAGGTLPACLTTGTATSTGVVAQVTGTIQSSMAISPASAVLCQGNPATFTSTASGTGSAPFYTWYVNNVKQSSWNAEFTYVPNNGDIVKATLTPSGNGTTCILGGVATSSSISLSVQGTQTASVTLLSSTNTVCSGTVVPISTSGVNLGSSPTYVWYVNGQVQSNGATYAYAPSNGDFVVAIANAGGSLPNCLAAAVVTSNGINFVVNTPQSVSITIASNTTSVCGGTNANFTATGTNAGTTPTYTWYVNGLSQGIGQVFTYAPFNGDQVQGVLNVGGDSPTCLTNTFATSNVIGLTVNASVPVQVNVIASTSSVCSGFPVSFTAVGVNAGTSPSYVWSVNGIRQSTGNTYMYVPANGDAVIAQVAAGGSLPSCISVTTASSNVVPITVSGCLLPQPGSITGPAFVATGSSSVVYSVPNVTGNGYIWTVPSGVQIVTGQGTSSITVDFGSSPITGTIGLQQANANGSASVSLDISSGVPPTSTTINGPTIVTEGEQGVTYSVPTLAGVNYQWTVPIGATIASGQGTGSVTVNFTGSVSGFVDVVQSNNYGNYADSVAVTTSFPTGISSTQFTEGERLFPNPTSGTFEVKLSNGVLDATVTVTDDKGVVQLVTDKLTGLGNDLSGGHYIVTIQTANSVRHLPLAKLR